MNVLTVMKPPVPREQNHLSREKWAKRIGAAWQKQVPSIFEVGALLEAAQVEFRETKRYGEWSAMVKSELPFTRETAFKLMTIAACDHLRDVAPGQQLPAHWTMLYDLTKLTPEQFEAGIKSGAINPKMQRKDVKALRGGEEKKHIKKKPDDAPLDLLEACAEFSIQITATSDRLPKEQRAQFFASVRAAVEALEKEQADD